MWLNQPGLIFYILSIQPMLFGFSGKAILLLTITMPVFLSTRHKKEMLYTPLLSG